MVLTLKEERLAKMLSFAKADLFGHNFLVTNNMFGQKC